MDRLLFRRVFECLRYLREDENIRHKITPQNVMDLLQASHLEYKRRRQKPFLRLIEKILNQNNQINASDPMNQTKKEGTNAWTIGRRPDTLINKTDKDITKDATITNMDGTSTIDRRANFSKRKKLSLPLEIIRHHKQTEDFVCICQFKENTINATEDFFRVTRNEYPSKLGRSVLLICGPTGCGKSCLGKWICKHYEFDMVCVDAALDFEDHYSKLSDMLNEKIVIMIEDVDNSTLCSSQGCTKQCRLFKRFIEQLKSKPIEDRAIVICTCRDPISLSETARILMDGEIKIPTPEKQCREAILRSLIPNSSQHNWISDVAELTSSYLPVHLIKLCSFSIQHQNQRRGHQLALNDFLEALKCDSTVNNSGNMLTSQCTNAVQVPETTWEDVGALDEIRKILQENLLTQYIPGAMEKEGRVNRLCVLSEPSGVLLVGPPGCGKTLLGKAVANELSINFLAVNGPELLNMYVGESERSVRRLFQQASNFKPCIIFFDEIDALCARRNEGGRIHDGPLVLNQLLVEMDGIRGRSGVFLMAATNMLDAIDPAMTRPGRFGTLVYVGLPDKKGRLDILKKMMKTCGKLVSDECFNEITDKTKGYTGADLKNLVSVAARHVLIKNPYSDELLDEDLLNGLTQTKPSLNDEQIKRYEITQRVRCCNYK